MMRKYVAIFLCLCLTAALLTGCGGGSIQQYEGDETAEATEKPDVTAEPTDEPDATAEPTDEPDATDEATDEPDATDEPTDEPDEDAEASDEPDEDAEPTDEPDEDAEATPEPTAKPGLGYAAYDADEIVLTYNGSEATWREYYYWLNYYAGYVQYMAAMGMPFSGWSGNDYDAEKDNATLVRTSAAEGLFQLRAIEALAEQKGVTLDEEDEATLQSAFEQAVDSYGDGDGTVTDEELAAYDEYIDGQFMNRELLDNMSRVSLLSDKLFKELYGEKGEKIPEQDVLAYADELGLLACKHILLMTVDPETGEPLSEEELAEKKAKADELYEQLAAVQDDPEALEELFDQLMNEHSEDTGLAYSPDGYTFVSGVMVPVFEETTAALEEYGLSEPVQSDYGYHIILRLPVDPDGVYTDSGGSSSSLRLAAGNEKLYQLLKKTTEDAQIVWRDGFEDIDIAEIFGE